MMGYIRWRYNCVLDKEYMLRWKNKLVTFWQNEAQKNTCEQHDNLREA